MRTGSIGFSVIYNMVQTLPLLQDFNGQVVALLSLSFVFVEGSDFVLLL